MEILERAPDWRNSFTKDENPFLRLMQDAAILAYVNRMNDGYFYWDSVKYRPAPGHITPLEAWCYVKISRIPQRRLLPIISVSGRQFSYWLPDQAQRELHFIDQHAVGNILVDEATVGAEERDRFVVSSLMEEAIASSILEGAATTRRVAKEMLREARAPRTHGERMVKNNYQTMLKVKERLDEPLSLEFLCELQASITEGTQDDPTVSGRLRRSDEPIHVVDTTDGTVLHTPPPADDLPRRLQALCEFANTTEKHTFIHPVVKGILLHFWLAYEHPFVDGNGRTARALFYWFLLKHQYWLVEFLPISRVILRAPARYKMAFLYSEHDEEDVTYFIHYHLRAFRLSIEGLTRYLKEKQEESRETDRLLRKFRSLNHRQMELIGHAVRHPQFVYTIARHALVHHIVYQTARTDLFELVKRGLFEHSKMGRTYQFRPREDLLRRLRAGEKRAQR